MFIACERSRRMITVESHFLNIDCNLDSRIQINTRRIDDQIAPVLTPLKILGHHDYTETRWIVFGQRGENSSQFTCCPVDRWISNHVKRIFEIPSFPIEAHCIRSAHCFRRISSYKCSDLKVRTRECGNCFHNFYLSPLCFINIGYYIECFTYLVWRIEFALPKHKLCVQKFTHLRFNWISLVIQKISIPVCPRLEILVGLFQHPVTLYGVNWSWVTIRTAQAKFCEESTATGTVDWVQRVLEHWRHQKLRK